MSRDRLAEDLVATAIELHKKRLWLKLGPDQGVFVEVPTHEFPVLATAIGHAGESYGVMIYVGEHALDSLARCLKAEGHDPELAEDLDFVGVTIEPLREIPPHMRAPLEAAGFVARRDVLAPMFAAKRPNRGAKSPNRTELKTILWVLKALLLTDASGALQPPSVFSGKIMTIRATGELNAPEFVTRISKAPAIHVKPVTENHVTFPAHLRNLPVLDTTWIVGLPHLLAAIENDDRAMRCCLVINDDSAEVVKYELVPDGSPTDVARILKDAFLDQPEGARLPKRIQCASESLYHALSDPLRRLGIKVELEFHNPKYQQAVEALQGALANAPFANKGPRRKPKVDLVPEDLADLKEADSELTSWLAQQVDDQDLVKNRALDRYFGPDAYDLDELLDEFEDLRIHMAFYEWLLADYRPTKTSRSHIEKLLKRKTLSAVDRMFLESRLNAEVSIWRLDSLDPGLTVTVECVLTGLRRTIHDRLLSSSALEGVFLPLRIIAAGNYYFPIVAGPPIPPLQIGGALDYLRQFEPDLSPATLKKTPELLGHLWAWSRQPQRRPLIRNTDGQVISPITAFFHVSDAYALVQALDARDDIEEHAPNLEWVWVKPEQLAPGLGDSTILAQLELMHDELILRLNSAERLEQARSWLESIRGVRFKSMRDHNQDDSEPLDDLLPEAISSSPPQEVLDQVGAIFHRMCMSWLDERIPALGGKTPRQMCATEAGRSQVATMIRTYPQPMGMGTSIDVPREAMLRELGLDS